MIIQLHYRQHAEEDNVLEGALREAFGPPGVVSDSLLGWQDIVCAWKPEDGTAHYITRTPAGVLWLSMNMPPSARVVEG